MAAKKQTTFTCSVCLEDDNPQQFPSRPSYRRHLWVAHKMDMVQERGVDRLVKLSEAEHERKVRQANICWMGKAQRKEYYSKLGEYRKKMEADPSADMLPPPCVAVKSAAKPCLRPAGLESSSSSDSVVTIASDGHLIDQWAEEAEEAGAWGVGSFCELDFPADAPADLNIQSSPPPYFVAVPVSSSPSPSSSYSVEPSIRHVSPCLSSPVDFATVPEQSPYYSPISSPEPLDMDSVDGECGSDRFFPESEEMGSVEEWDSQVDSDEQSSVAGESLSLMPISHRPVSPASVSGASLRSSIEEVDVTRAALRNMAPVVANLVRAMGSFASTPEIVRVAARVDPTGDRAVIEVMVWQAMASERCLAVNVTEAVAMASLLDPTGNLGIQQAMAMFQEVLGRQQ